MVKYEYGIVVELLLPGNEDIVDVEEELFDLDICEPSKVYYTGSRGNYEGYEIVLICSRIFNVVGNISFDTIERYITDYYNSLLSDPRVVGWDLLYIRELRW